MSSAMFSNAVPLPQVAYAAASITASYTNAGHFTSPLIEMAIISTLDQPVQVSFDGVNDHIAIPAGSSTPVYFPLHFKANRAVLPKPTIFVKRIGTPTTGSLYVTGFSATIP
jgi:hypothetical protein